MANLYVNNLISQLQDKFGNLRKIGDGYSLYQIVSNDVLIYFRYSKISQASKLVTKAFYGLRREDLLLLKGRQAFICFVWDNSSSPILFPFAQFEIYLSNVEPSKDGQYKALIFFKPTGTEVYLANVGKFNVDSYYGLDSLLKINQTNLALPSGAIWKLDTLPNARFPAPDRCPLQACRV